MEVDLLADDLFYQTILYLKQKLEIP